MHESKSFARGAEQSNPIYKWKPSDSTWIGNWQIEEGKKILWFD